MWNSDVVQDELCLVCMRHKSECGHLQAPPNDSDALPAGSILVDRYLIGMVLGSGGFGVTYIAWDYQEARRIAIKEFFPREIAYRRANTGVITPRSNRERDFDNSLTKFADEATRLYAFNHPGIVQVLHYFEANGAAYIVMPYVEGMQLEAYLQKQSGNRVGEGVAMSIARQVLDTLEVVHGAGMIHRDIKPENLYLKEYDVNQMMLLDFGSAREATSGLTIFVTHGYAPPEQYSDYTPQGAYTDMYGLAATLYRCVTGVVPPRAAERQTSESGDPLLPISHYAYVTPTFENAVMRGLRIHRSDRPQDVNDMRRLIGLMPGYVQEQPVPGQRQARAPAAPSTSALRNIGRWFTRLMTRKSTGSPSRKPTGFTGTLVGLSGEYDGARISLDAAVVIGRDFNTCNLVFAHNEAAVSRQHLRIEYDPDARLFKVLDLNSRNGTYLLKPDYTEIRMEPHLEILVQSGTEFYLGDPNCARFRVEEHYHEV